MFVIRKNAEKLYINIAVFSILTILLTRLFLELSGYPQISSETLHIAHLLWGGLFLLVGSIFLVIFKGKKSEFTATIFVGIGWGLFLDEIGKFITVNNDYFYKPAAPLIYIISIILFIPLILLLKKRRYSEKSLLYNTIENVEEIIENDFDPDEKDEVLTNLNLLIKSKDKEVQVLAKHLLLLVKKHEADGKHKDIPFLYNLFYKLKSEFKVISKKGWLYALVNFSIIIKVVVNALLIGTDIGLLIVSGDTLSVSSEQILYISVIAAKIVIGLLLIIFMYFSFFKKSVVSTKIGRFLILFSLLFVNLLFMYFNQFNTYFDIVFDLFLYFYFGFL